MVSSEPCRVTWSSREYFRVNKEDSEDSAVTKWGTKCRRMNSSVRKMSILDTMRLRLIRPWKVTSQAGGETKPKHPISSLLSAKTIFSKKKNIIRNTFRRYKSRSSHADFYHKYIHLYSST